MKNILFLFLIVLGFGLSSCGSDDNASSSSEDHFTAKIDGNDFEATNLMATNAIILFQCKHSANSI